MAEQETEDEVQYDARQGEPYQTFVYHDYDGERIELKADKAGVVQPTSEAEVRAADAFGLPPVDDTAEGTV